MIAPAKLPPRFAEWNAAEGAPDGRQVRGARWRRLLLGAGSVIRATGPFGRQRNSSTRSFEYPWAFETIRPEARLEVVEMGGGLSGLQFVLAREGCRVTNVDPGEPGAGGRAFGTGDIEQLNRIFGTSVRHVPARIVDAGLPESRFDRVVSLSVLEHLEPGEALASLRAAAACLRVGGLCVLTLDLFLNLRPFTSRESNPWGRNLDVRALVEGSGLKLVAGRRGELLGYPEFDADAVQSHLEDYWMGRYPVLAQCLVLEKA
jgi:Methyltransferase domain